MLLRRYFPRLPWPEAVVLGTAAVNFLYVGWEAQHTLGGCLVCPWYYPWHWTNLPSRLLLASAFALFPHSVSRLVAVALAGQGLLLVAYYCLSSDMLALVVLGSDETLLQTQGVVAAAVAGCGSLRLLGRAAGWPLPQVIRAALTTGLAIVVAGFLCSFFAARTCEERVANWVARDGLGGRPFTAWEGIRGWADSLSVFRRVGANVSPIDSEVDGVPGASVGPALCPVPFVVRVRYTYWVSERSDFHNGEWLFVVGPGFVTRLEAAEALLPDADRWVWSLVGFPWSRMSGVPW